TRLFLRDENGRRPVFGGTEKFQTDPYWRDLILFYEYFYRDNGAGLWASHPTGWTALVGKLIQQYGEKAIPERANWISERLATDLSSRRTLECFNRGSTA